MAWHIISKWYHITLPYTLLNTIRHNHETTRERISHTQRIQKNENPHITRKNAISHY